MKIFTVFLVMFLFANSAGNASEWIVDYEKSYMKVLGHFQGKDRELHFEKFELSIQFDPTDPTSMSIKNKMFLEEMKVWVTKNELYSPKDTKLLKGVAFQLPAMPNIAEYTSISVEASEDNYLMGGVLLLSNFEAPVQLEFELVEEDGSWIVQGTGQIERREGFQLAQKISEDNLSEVGTLEFKIVAKKE